MIANTSSTVGTDVDDDGTVVSGGLASGVAPDRQDAEAGDSCCSDAVGTATELIARRVGSYRVLGCWVSGEVFGIPDRGRGLGPSQAS
jgi:hypothetical protein